MSTNSTRHLILALLAGSVLVVLCYFFVDRPLAQFIHNHRFYSNEFLFWPQFLSIRLTYCAIAGMAGVVAWWIWRPGGYVQRLLLAISANLVVTEIIKNVLKGMFGRTWPETWMENNNPSLIANGVYGFHPFQFDKTYGAFPSGHAAAAFAVVSILWIGLPRWRWLYAAAAGIVCLALVGLNFHYVGDVIAGAMLGSTTGFVATRIFAINPSPSA
jgi:membrane-associated phospholipid phosphatase